MLTHLNPALRALVLVFWALVALWSWSPLWRTISRRGDSGDHKEAALVVAGVFIISFQVQGLSGAVTPRTDPWTATSLAGLAIPPLMTFWLAYLPRTPETHRRGAVFSFLAIAVACILGGGLG